jgi:hypothetical protein
MKKDRYAEWIAVWDWFATTNTREIVPRENWNSLYELLSGMWQDERKDATPEELAAHAGAISKFKQ